MFWQALKCVYGIYVVGTATTGAYLGHLTFNEAYEASRTNNMIMGALGGAAVGVLTPYFLAMECVSMVFNRRTVDPATAPARATRE